MGALTIAMKKSKFTESQIVFALQQAESGVTVAKVCRKFGISGIGMGKGYRSLDINVYKSVEEMNKAFRSNPGFDASRGVPRLVTIE